jgi:hypothetical protein
VVGEAVVSLVLADAFLEKFSGDSLGEIQRNYASATARLEARFRTPAPPKRNGGEEREGGPAPPKREDRKEREGGPASPKREDRKEREGG